MIRRLRTALVLGGAVVLTSYISAPAAPTPARSRTSAIEVDAIATAAPLVTDAAQETTKLRERLATVPERPAPRRDPFSFGKSPRTPRAATAAAPEQEREVVETVPAPALVWPKLVALLTDKDKITAVLGVGDSVEMFQVGQTTGEFLIREITATSVEIVHVATSVATRLTLR